jgi:hypothetical protein
MLMILQQRNRSWTCGESPLARQETSELQVVHYISLPTMRPTKQEDLVKTSRKNQNLLFHILKTKNFLNGQPSVTFPQGITALRQHFIIRPSGGIISIAASSVVGFLLYELSDCRIRYTFCGDYIHVKNRNFAFVHCTKLRQSRAVSFYAELGVKQTRWPIICQDMYKVSLIPRKLARNTGMIT